MLDLLLPISGAQTDLTKMNIEIEAYITRDEAKTENETKNFVQTVWFKPNPFSSHATLGPNGWLWLGAIISSSVVMFLLLLGVITRCYKYLKDHNGMVYSWIFKFKTLWNMILVCLCILMGTSAVILRQKQLNARDGKQIQNMELPTPRTSPGSWLVNEERELENLPHQSLVQATNVPFG